MNIGVSELQYIGVHKEKFVALFCDTLKWAKCHFTENYFAYTWRKPATHELHYMQGCWVYTGVTWNTADNE